MIESPIESAEYPIESAAEAAVTRELIQSYLDNYGEELQKDLNEAIEWRRPFEARWLRAEAQYRGGTLGIAGSKQTGGYATPKQTENEEHRHTNDNITKVIIRKIVARASNMLFATDELQADIEPSPVPTENAFIPEGVSVEDFAKSSAEKMEKQIKDSLAECDYSKHGRQVIADAVKVGIGVFHGPYPKTIQRKAASTVRTDDGGALTTFTITETTKPFVERLDYRMFFPRPCKTINDCDGVYVLYLMTSKQIRDLEKMGFDHDQIDRLLATPGGGTYGMLNDGIVVGENGKTAILKNKWPLWKYVGQIKKKCACYLSGDVTEDIDDKETMPGEVWFSQGITLKAVPSDSDALPFHVFNYNIDTESIFGFGATDDVADDQYDVNLAWGAVKLNAMASAFPIIGILKAAYMDENGAMEYPPRRPILLEGDLPVRDILQVDPIPSTVGDALQVLDRAKQNANEHGMVQSMEESAPANAHIGAAMFALIKAEDNIIQSNIAKQWDDNITKPLLTQWVEYELLNNDDPYLKASLDVVPKGVSHLLTKDIMLQHNMTLLQLSDNPQNAPMFKRYDLVKTIVRNVVSNADQILATEEEVAQAAQAMAQQPSPESMRADLERLKIEKAFEAQQIKSNGEIAIARMRIESDQLVAQMTLEAASIKAATDERMTGAEQDSRVRIAAITDQSKRFIATLTDSRERERNAAKTTIEAEKIAQGESKLVAQVNLEKPFRV